MKTQWLRIERWLAEHAPEVLAGLNPPASLEAIRETEKLLDCEFPQDVVDSFLVHDGERFGTGGLMDGWELLSLEGVLHKWRCWRDLVEGGDFDHSKSESDGDISELWYDLAWIPLTYDGSGDHDCLDLDPGAKGRPGQVIRMNHDDPNRWVVAESYRKWLTTFADDLEAGRFELDEDGYLHRVEEQEEGETIWNLGNDASRDALELLERIIEEGSVAGLAADLERVIEPPMIQPGLISKWFGAKPERHKLNFDDAVRAMVVLEIVAEALGNGTTSTPAALRHWVRHDRASALQALAPSATKALSALHSLAKTDGTWDVRSWEWHPAATSLEPRLQS